MVKLKNLDHRTAQMIIASTGYYKGDIDGDIGPKTMAAVRIIQSNLPVNTQGWSDARIVVAAVQRVLDVQGYEPGLIDGYMGHNTQNAISAWMGDQLKNPMVVDREPVDKPIKTSEMQLKYPLQSGVEKFYGKAGSAACTAGSVQLAIPLVLSWNTSQKVKKFACHEKVQSPLTLIFQEAVKHYGESEFRRLRLDLFGGCFNDRNMRGSSAKSMHAYGIAVDLDPERNQLKWDNTRAAFAKPDYIPWWNIVVAYGATPAGYAWNGDWMHFQFARLK